MNTPKPHPPVSAVKHDEVDQELTPVFNPSKWVVEAMKEQIVEIAQAAAPKPKATKPKEPYFPKNRPLADHPGLIALKKNLEGK